MKQIKCRSKINPIVIFNNYDDLLEKYLNKKSSELPLKYAIKNRELRTVKWILWINNSVNRMALEIPESVLDALDNSTSNVEAWLMLSIVPKHHNPIVDGEIFYLDLDGWNNHEHKRQFKINFTKLINNTTNKINVFANFNQ